MLPYQLRVDGLVRMPSGSGKLKPIVRVADRCIDSPITLL